MVTLRLLKTIQIDVQFRMFLYTAIALLAVVPPALAQAVATDPPSVAPIAANPIAIVPLDSRVPGSAAAVTGALEVTGGRALISTNGTVTSGTTTTDVALPNRGTLRVCAATSVKLAADRSTAQGETPALMMAIDHGAIEADFTVGRNADILLTPDFRILIGGPGSSNMKVRLGQGGDTCVDNPGGNAPYVLVTSVFDNYIYRIQPGQRVMFQHGSVHEVVDQEKEPCGCPPSPAEARGNDFPLAQSEGLAPLAPVKPAPPTPTTKAATQTPPLVFQAPGSAAAQPQAEAQPTAPASPPPAAAPAPKKKSGFFGRIGHFFRRVFGAE